MVCQGEDFVDMTSREASPQIVIVRTNLPAVKEDPLAAPKAERTTATTIVNAPGNPLSFSPNNWVQERTSTCFIHRPSSFTVEGRIVLLDYVIVHRLYLMLS